MRQREQKKTAPPLAGLLCAGAASLFLCGAGSRENRIIFEQGQPAGKTQEGLDLYQQPAEISFTVSDPDWGIAQVSWSLEAEGSRILEQENIDFQDRETAAPGGFELLEQTGKTIFSARKHLSIQEEAQELLLRVGLKNLQGQEYWESIYLAVDGTAPEITLDTEGSGAFLRESQHYRLRVKDKNFDPESILIQGNVPLPLVWRGQGGVYQAEFSLEEEGDYCFSVSGKDRAGNEFQGSLGDCFVLDRTPPIITIGEEDGSSLRSHSLQPLITIEDRAVESAGVAIRLNGRRSGNMEGWIRQLETEDGSLRYQVRSLSGGDLDDVYSLQAECRDLAGNVSRKEVVFTVNCRGSRYAVSRETQEILGSYQAEPREFVLIEENLDLLQEDTIQVRLVQNGVEFFPEMGRDYGLDIEETEEGYRYTYTLPGKLFREDGFYTLCFRSEDEAGNRNDSSLFFDDWELAFGIDRVKPLIQGIGQETGEDCLMIFQIRDNLMLKDVSFLWNGTALPFEAEMERYQLRIPGKDRGILEIRAEDAAGNIEEQRITVGEEKEEKGSLPVLPAAAAAGGLIALVLKKKLFVTKKIRI